MYLSGLMPQSNMSTSFAPRALAVSSMAVEVPTNHSWDRSLQMKASVGPSANASVELNTMTRAKQND